MSTVLDRRIALQAPTVARDPEYGSAVATWSTVDTVWARIDERDAREATTADQRVMTRRITVRIRYRADVLNTWRVLHGARVLRIAGTVEIGRRQYLDMTCEESTGA